MAIYDYVDSKVATGAEAFGEGTPAIMGAGPIGFFCINRHIDLSVAGDLFIASDGKFESGDTIDIFNVSEGMLIQGVVIEITTAEGESIDMDVGDGDVDGFIDGISIGSTGWYISSDSGQETNPGDFVDGTTYHNGKLYTTADTIGLYFNGADADTAIFDVYIYGIDFRPVA